MSALTTGENLLAQFIAFAEAVALGQPGSITNTNTITQNVDLLGKKLKVTETITETVTATPE